VKKPLQGRNHCCQKQADIQSWYSNKFKSRKKTLYSLCKKCCWYLDLQLWYSSLDPVMFENFEKNRVEHSTSNTSAPERRHERLARDDFNPLKGTGVRRSPRGLLETEQAPQAPMPRCVTDQRLGGWLAQAPRWSQMSGRERLAAAPHHCY
jgi:hypothetical protein